jgi:hypothetical protein
MMRKIQELLSAILITKTIVATNNTQMYVPAVPTSDWETIEGPLSMLDIIDL